MYMDCAAFIQTKNRLATGFVKLGNLEVGDENRRNHFLLSVRGAMGKVTFYFSENGVGRSLFLGWRLP